MRPRARRQRSSERVPSVPRAPQAHSAARGRRVRELRLSPALTLRSRRLFSYPPYARRSTPTSPHSGRARRSIGTLEDCASSAAQMRIKITARLTISSMGTPDGPIIGPPIIFSRSTPHSRHLRRPSRHVAPSRISANGVVLHCEIIAHYTFSCPAHWARSRRSASRAPRSSRRPRTRHVPRSRTRDETRTASTYRCEPPRSSTKCASQRANGGE